MSDWIKELVFDYTRAHWREIAEWAIARMQEKTTMVGAIGIIATALHLTFSTSLTQALVTLGLAAGSVLAIIYKEKVGK